MNNKWISIIICLIILFQVPLNVRADDVPSDWATGEILELQNMEILREETFSGYTQNISRVEYAYLIFKLYETIAGQPISEVCNLEYKNGFSDCDDYFVIALYKAGIIKGYPDGTFKPGAPITREEVACFYVRAMEKVGIELPYQSEDINVFDDSSLFSSWAKESLLKCYNNHIMNGNSTTTMNPKGFTKVEESLAILYRILSNEGYYVVGNINTQGFDCVQYDGKYLYYVYKDIHDNEVGVKKYEDFTYQETYLEGEIEGDIYVADGNIYYKNSTQQLKACAIDSKEISDVEYELELESEVVLDDIVLYSDEEVINEAAMVLIESAVEYVVVGEYIIYTSAEKKLYLYSIKNMVAELISNSQYENLQVLHNYFLVDELLSSEESELRYNHLLPVFYIGDYFYY